MSIQFFDAGEVNQGSDNRQEVILMAAPRRFIEDNASALSGNDLELLAIDAVPGALARIFTDQVKTDDEELSARVLIDVGYDGTKVLITKGQRVCFFKMIDLGGRQFDIALASALQLPLATAAQARRDWLNGAGNSETDARIVAAMTPLTSELAREIGLCLRYYGVTFRGKRPEEVVFVGGESSNTWLWVRLCEEVGLAPCREDPMSNIDLAPVAEQIGGVEAWPAWVVAAGLAQKPTGQTRQRKSRGAA